MLLDYMLKIQEIKKDLKFMIYQQTRQSKIIIKIVGKQEKDLKKVLQSINIFNIIIFSNFEYLYNEINSHIDYKII